MIAHITIMEAREAESRTLDQIAYFGRFLLVDFEVCKNPVDAEKCKIVMFAAEHNPVTFNALLAQRDVGNLFESGALYFDHAQIVDAGRAR